MSPEYFGSKGAADALAPQSPQRLMVKLEGMSVTLRLLLLAASAAMIAGAAMAEDAPVSTASRSTDDLATWLKDAPPVEQTGQDDVRADGAPVQADRKIHGEVGAAIGSGGYRSAYGIVNIPIGKNGEATVAVATGHDNFRIRRWGAGVGALGVEGCSRRV